MLVNNIELPQALVYLGVLAALSGLLAGEVKLIQGTVQFIKTIFKMDGNRVVGVSFVVGLVYGGLLMGLAWGEVSKFPVYVQVILAILYVLMSGLFASGFYDLKDSVIDSRHDPE